MLGVTERFRSYQSMSYQSIELPKDVNEVEPGNSLRSRLRRSFKRVLRQIGCVLLLAVVSAYVAHSWMTGEEREIARENGISTSWSAARQIREAQRRADDSNARFLNSKAKNTIAFSGQEGVLARLLNSKARKTTALSGNIRDAFFWIGKNHDSRSGLGDQTSAPDGCEATIVILRHCEKESIQEHCDFVGYERSVFLSTLFGDDQERWPAPSYIYAMGPGDRSNKNRMNFREIETVGPLSEKTGVLIDYSASIKHIDLFAAKLLKLVTSGEMCGKVAVVSWKHSSIGDLARHLGCGPAQGCPVAYEDNTFDRAWQIRLVHREFGHSAQKTLKLPKSPQWKVFGSVQQEGFDPLAFSKLSRDYPPDGGSTKKQPGWLHKAAEIPERESLKDTDDWLTAEDEQFLAIPNNQNNQ